MIIRNIKSYLNTRKKFTKDEAKSNCYLEKLQDCVKEINNLSYRLEKESNEKINNENKLKAIANVYEMDVDKLKEQPNNFAPYKNENSLWEYEQRICSLGGCPFEFIICHTEIEALQQTIIKTIIGKEIDVSFPCPDCYREHMRECI